MKAYMYRNLVVVLLLGLSLFSCNPKSSTIVENDIQFDSISVNKTYNLLENPENPNCNLEIKFTYPVKFADKDVLSSINKIFVYTYFGENYENLSPQQAVEKYTEEYLSNYKSLEEDFKAELKEEHEAPIASWFSYYEMASNKIEFNRDDLLGFSIFFEGYTGGAHGSHSLMNHVINLKTGTLVKEKDIFADGFQNHLANILVEKIAADNNCTTPSELENIGFFSTDEIYPNGNFMVDETGITYCFNEYEIAAYVVGTINVHLPYSEIKHLLRPDSPISPLADKE